MRVDLKLYWTAWMITVGAIILGVRFLQGQLDRDARILLGLTLLAGMLFKTALGRSDNNHLQYALVPAVIIGLMLVRRFVTSVMHRRIPVWSSTFWCGIGAVILSVGVLQPARSVLSAFIATHLKPAVHKFQRTDWDWKPLPNARRAKGLLLPAVTAKEVSSVLDYITTHTRPGEPIVAIPNEAAYYYLAERPNATRFSVAYLAVTREDRLAMIAALEKSRPTYIIYSLGTWRIDGIFEATQLPELAEYVKRSYLVEERIGDTIILRRKEELLQDR